MRREKPRSCLRVLKKLAFRFRCSPRSLIQSPGRRLPYTLAWTQREEAKSLRFTAIFLATGYRTITQLSFVTTTTSNQSMKPTNGMFDVRALMFDVALTPVVAYLFIVSCLP